MRQIASLLLGLGLATAVSAAPQPVVPGARAVPYWVSLSAGEARMRTGPGRTYPASWIYHRAGLPLLVLKVLPGWRKVRDPDGTEGWMIANLLSADRAVYLRGAEAVRAAADPAAAIRWTVEPGVSARLESCAAGWCKLAFGEREGFVESGRLWGVAPNETVE